ncbi:uncharacterized protein LOC135701512 [Ochlerotatus camptorhynchus]|uniref:uncharacterized protein LOC135701512 n=1 Tax=Ochlerotatus camptorhynchus TaxID=644619 RepID=UPI0031D26640
MNHCCVISCLNKRNDKRHKFFAFPSDLDVCTQWVDFCHCPEISERLTSGGPYGLRKFTICSEHFEPSAVKAVDWNGQLPVNTVPVRIGKTHMTQDMLLEKGFTLEPQTDNEAHSIDQVLVEMLSPEEMDNEPEDESNFEFVGVKRIKMEQLELQFEDEIKQEPVEQEQPQTAVEERATKEECSAAPVTQKQEPCVYCVNFKPRYEYELKKNKRLEEVIAQNKKKIANETTKMQKLHDRFTLKKLKRNELRKKFSELRKRCKKGIPLDTITEPVTESDDDDDEAGAWW